MTTGIFASLCTWDYALYAKETRVRVNITSMLVTVACTLQNTTYKYSSYAADTFAASFIASSPFFHMLA